MTGHRVRMLAWGLMLALVLTAGLAFAAAPDKTSLPAKNGAVAFDHKTHAAMPGTTCKTCHHTATGTNVDKKCSDCHKAEAQGKTPSLKDAMHKNCKDCHAKLKKGPSAKCGDCHKK